MEKGKKRRVDEKSRGGGEVEGERGSGEGEGEKGR